MSFTLYLSPDNRNEISSDRVFLKLIVKYKNFADAQIKGMMHKAFALDLHWALFHPLQFSPDVRWGNPTGTMLTVPGTWLNVQKKIYQASRCTFCLRPPHSS